MADYIRLRQFGASNNNGYKLLCSLITDVEFDKGFDSVDLSVPSTDSSGRLLLITSGLKEDYELTIELIYDGTNKAFSINNSGDETNLNKITTAEQTNFILDTLIVPDLSAVYELYIEWLNRTLIGQLKIRGRVSGEDHYNKVSLRASFKVGTNILGV